VFENVTLITNNYKRNITQNISNWCLLFKVLMYRNDLMIFIMNFQAEEFSVEIINKVNLTIPYSLFGNSFYINYSEYKLNFNIV